MDQRELAEIIERYRAKLLDMGITAERIILFGSQAQGTAQGWSDIDLVVISEDFRDMELLERLETLGKAAARILEPIEAMGMTPQEWEEGHFPFFKAMAERGVVYR